MKIFTPILTVYPTYMDWYICSFGAINLQMDKLYG